MANKMVKILTNSSNKNIPTVNIATVKTGNITTHSQATGTVGKHIPQYQDSGGTVKGLKTIHIAGYSGPG